jgi:plastocyanin
MPKTLALLAGTAALALGAAACGGSSNSASSAATGSGGAASTAPATAAGSTGSGATARLTIMAMPDGSLMFTRDRYTVKAGRVQMTFENGSGEPHNLYVQKGTDGTVLGGTPTISSGSRTLTLQLAPGTYTYYCAVPGHRAAGMQGTLTVTR